jgi:hypothetical protein
VHSRLCGPRPSTLIPIASLQPIEGRQEGLQEGGADTVLTCVRSKGLGTRDNWVKNRPHKPMAVGSRTTASGCKFVLTLVCGRTAGMESQALPTQVGDGGSSLFQALDT